MLVAIVQQMMDYGANQETAAIRSPIARSAAAYPSPGWLPRCGGAMRARRHDRPGFAYPPLQKRENGGARTGARLAPCKGPTL
ncbi:MAG: hypothetical protein BGP16_04055 [Sphingobium sp. 66-54]|nr:MAG: hypothetical protein BGP16_04055 [Sphingobium sp. 66-54]